MNLITAIVLLLVGVSTFLLGMRFMSSGLRKAASGGVKSLFKKIQNNRFAGIGIGAAVTAIIQSSDATNAMIVGFINAGVMSIFQGFSVMLGAYLGTTATGLLVSLSSFNISLYLMLFTFVGVVLLFFKNKLVNNIGEMLAGLGLLFFGLDALKQGFGYEDIVSFFANVFNQANFPLLLFVIGIVITALIQSSSATTGVVIVMVGTGVIPFASGLYIAMGATIGSVFNTVLASIGTNANAKRTVFMAMTYRIIMGLIGLGAIWIFADPLTDFLKSVFYSPELAIATFMVVYNVIGILLFSPLIKPLETLSIKLIKDKEAEKKRQALLYIDDHLLNTPSIALMQVKKEIENMFQLSKTNFTLGYQMMMDLDLSKSSELEDRENSIDYINNEITAFLIKLSSKTDSQDGKVVGGYFHVINDIERIGDHASNFLDMARKMKEDGLNFSEVAHEEFASLYKVVMEMFDMSLNIFDENKGQELDLEKLHQLEKDTDIMKEELSTKHYDRLKNGTCHVELSPFYTSLVSELERVADHLTNVGYSFLNPTGDDPNKEA